MKIRFNQQDINAWVKGPEVTGAVNQALTTLKSRLGKGYETYISVKNRSRGYIRAKSYQAHKDALNHHTIEKAIGGGI